jgi:hypothetical protein
MTVVNRSHLAPGGSLQFAPSLSVTTVSVPFHSSSRLSTSTSHSSKSHGFNSTESPLVAFGQSAEFAITASLDLDIGLSASSNGSEPLHPTKTFSAATAYNATAATDVQSPSASDGQALVSGAQTRGQSAWLVGVLAFLVMLLIAALFLLFFCSRRRTKIVPDTGRLCLTTPLDLEEGFCSDTEFISQDMTEVEFSLDDLME